MKQTFTYSDTKFLMNGEPYIIISGAIHYFRVHPEYWEDRLKKLKACGFNTVETYTCWNLHERKEGQFDFSGRVDIVRFIEIAEKLDLNIIVRPGPYICAEWEFGGLPSWLLSYPNMSLRCNDALYLEKVKPYYRELLSRIRPHLITNGGKVIMVQVENEYGSYGDDKDYLRKIVEIYRENGIDCMLFTSDGEELWMQSGGALPELLSAANFGSKANEKLPVLNLFQKNRPLMCGEFWCGWFDHWYEKGIYQRNDKEIENELNEFFDMNASFNFYMFHGGTNFGFTNGANCEDGENVGSGYASIVTSYDYAAPLNEAGDATRLYYTIKNLIEKRTGVKAPDVEIVNVPKKAYGKLPLTKSAKLFENLRNLANPIHTVSPKSMEELGQDFGYILYRTTLNGPFEKLPLNLGEVHDRALIYLDGKYIGMYERSRENEPINIGLGFNQTARLDILVENMGRINYGTKLLDKKGLINGVALGRRFHFGWETYTLTMDDLSGLTFNGKDEKFETPVFLSANLKIQEKPCDTFLRLNGFNKGFVVVNGFNIGRYFNTAGPQKTLYIPAPVLKEGNNEIIVFESDGYDENAVIEFLNHPELNNSNQ